LLVQGEAVISATTTDGSELSAQCIVTVIGDDDFGDILPEDKPDDPAKVPTVLWTSALNDHAYTGKPVTQEFRVYDHMNMLVEGKDYTVKYSNNTKAGRATVTITGKGNYVGTLVRTFNILRHELTAADTKVILNKDLFIQNNKVQKPTVSVETNGIKLKVNIDYIVSFSNINSSAEGTYAITVNGKDNYTGSVETSYQIIKPEEELKPMSSLTVSGIKNKTYTCERIIQDIVVKDGKTILEIGTDYTVEYEYNTDAGKAMCI